MAYGTDFHHKCSSDCNFRQVSNGSCLGEYCLVTQMKSIIVTWELADKLSEMPQSSLWSVVSQAHQGWKEVLNILTLKCYSFVLRVLHTIEGIVHHNLLGKGENKISAIHDVMFSLNCVFCNSHTYSKTGRYSIAR